MADLSKKRITAKEARKITEETDTVLAHIYKAIKDHATDGVSNLTWGVELDTVVRKRIVEQLKLDGYDITDIDPILDIKW